MKYIFSLITLVLCTSTYSQEELVTEYPMNESALLWQITNDDIQDTSYLFGTMHMIQKEYFLFPDKLETLVQNSDALVMEIAGMPDPYEMMKYMMLPEGTVWDFFDELQEDSLMTWVTTNTDFSEEMVRNTFSKMKPFALIQLTALSQFTGETESYEEDFTKIATIDSIEMIGLETIADQMKIFDDLTDEEITEMVMASIRSDEEESAASLKEMQSTYFNQQIDSLYMLIHSEGGTIAEKESAFLTDRNKNWIPKIIAQIEKKKTFVAVGAGHLGGAEGVIRLLQREGYTLTPIRL